MTPHHDREALLDAVTRTARDAEPPDLFPGVGEQMIRRAIAGARAPARSRRLRPVLLVASAAAAAALVVLALRGFESQPGAFALRDAEPSAITLPSGDRIAATAGAEFELASATPEERRIAVRRGSLRFEVRPLGVGERFEVSTPHLRARVVGTVFSVEVKGDRSLVRVESGVVEVLVNGLRYELDAGEWLDSKGSGPKAGPGPGASRWKQSAPTSSLPPLWGREHPESEPEPEPEPGPGSVPGPGSEPESEPESESEPEPESGLEPRQVRRSAPANALGAARRLIVEKEYARALEVARSPHAGDQGNWRMIEADALRGLARYGDAAVAYLAAAELLDPEQATSAGYLAAKLFVEKLGDLDAAGDALDRTDADRLGSPLEERALGLRLRILVEARRTDAARASAARYLERFPDGSLREWAESLR